MNTYRICRAPFTALDGDGARRYEGRWNSPGHPAVYTSLSIALAAVELVMHLDPEELPDDLVIVKLAIPNSIPCTHVNPAHLSPTWRDAESDECRAIGDNWLAHGRRAILRVPSVVIPTEFNILVNPRHRLATRISAVESNPFALDRRLVKRN